MSSSSPGPTTSPADSDLVRAARGLPVTRTPVWFMRQAGRSLPEYRSLRAGTAMLDACQDPDMVTEITLQPVRRHGVDAAILFSDIVLPLVVGKARLGFFYADRTATAPEGVPPDETALIRALKRQVLAALAAG